MPEVKEEVTREDVTALPGTDETFDAEAVPVLLELVGDRMHDYVSQQSRNDEPVSLLGFGLELIYQTGAEDARAESRGRRS